MSECEYGKKDIESVGGNKISFNGRIGKETNPIAFPFQEWPGEVKIKVDVTDEDQDFSLVDHYEYQYNSRILRRKLDSPAQGLTLSGRNTKLEVDLRVFCDVHYFGNDCSIYCVETDDDTGHFNCDPSTGERICKLGWKGSDCLTNIDDCIGNRCYFGSTCVDGLNLYTCACPPGRTGTTCAAEINECASRPCQNGGQCLDASNAFICECKPGYAGLLCEVEINECFSYPCLNGGTCEDRIGEFTCQCAQGYEGRRCEIDVDECAFNPCVKATECINLPGDYQCNCFPGYTGKHCEANIDECSSKPCQNGGLCIDKVDGYTCRCAAGYSGTNCERLKDHCSPNYCKNGATCHSGLHVFTCECPAQFRGILCSDDVDECVSDSSICGLQGTCVNTHGGYRCECSDGYEGKHCGIETDECLKESVPCYNGGLCIDELGYYRCECQAGFSGPRCEYNIDECDSSPCINNGTCMDQIDGFLCACVLGYTGMLCENLFKPSTEQTTHTTHLTTTEAPTSTHIPSTSTGLTSQDFTTRKDIDTTSTVSKWTITDMLTNRTTSATVSRTLPNTVAFTTKDASLAEEQTDGTVTDLFPLSTKQTSTETVTTEPTIILQTTDDSEYDIFDNDDFDWDSSEDLIDDYEEYLGEEISGEEEQHQSGYTFGMTTTSKQDDTTTAGIDSLSSQEQKEVMSSGESPFESIGEETDQIPVNFPAGELSGDMLDTISSGLSGEIPSGQDAKIVDGNIVTDRVSGSGEIKIDASDKSNYISETGDEADIYSGEHISGDMLPERGEVSGELSKISSTVSGDQYLVLQDISGDTTTLMSGEQTSGGVHSEYYVREVSGELFESSGVLTEDQYLQDISGDESFLASGEDISSDYTSEFGVHEVSGELLDSSGVSSGDQYLHDKSGDESLIVSGDERLSDTKSEFDVHEVSGELFESSGDISGDLYSQNTSGDKSSILSGEETLRDEKSIYEEGEVSGEVFESSGEISGDLYSQDISGDTSSIVSGETIFSDTKSVYNVHEISGGVFESSGETSGDLYSQDISGDTSSIMSGENIFSETKSGYTVHQISGEASESSGEISGDLYSQDISGDNKYVSMSGEDVSGDTYTAGREASGELFESTGDKSEEQFLAVQVISGDEMTKDNIEEISGISPWPTSGDDDLDEIKHSSRMSEESSDLYKEVPGMAVNSGEPHEETSKEIDNSDLHLHPAIDTVASGESDESGEFIEVIKMPANNKVPIQEDGSASGTKDVIFGESGDLISTRDDAKDMPSGSYQSGNMGLSTSELIGDEFASSGQINDYAGVMNAASGDAENLKHDESGEFVSGEELYSGKVTKETSGSYGGRVMPNNNIPPVDIGMSGESSGESENVISVEEASPQDEYRTGDVFTSSGEGLFSQEESGDIIWARNAETSGEIPVPIDESGDKIDKSASGISEEKEPSDEIISIVSGESGESGEPSSSFNIQTSGEFLKYDGWSSDSDVYQIETEEGSSVYSGSGNVHGILSQELSSGYPGINSEESGESYLDTVSEMGIESGNKYDESQETSGEFPIYNGNSDIKQDLSETSKYMPIDYDEPVQESGELSSDIFDGISILRDESGDTYSVSGIIEYRKTDEYHEKGSADLFDDELNSEYIIVTERTIADSTEKSASGQFFTNDEIDSPIDDGISSNIYTDITSDGSGEDDILPSSTSYVGFNSSDEGNDLVNGSIYIGSGDLISTRTSSSKEMKSEVNDISLKKENVTQTAFKVTTSKVYMQSTTKENAPSQVTLYPTHELSTLNDSSITSDNYNNYTSKQFEEMTKDQTTHSSPLKSTFGITAPHKNTTMSLNTDTIKSTISTQTTRPYVHSPKTHSSLLKSTSPPQSTKTNLRITSGTEGTTARNTSPKPTSAQRKSLSHPCRHVNPSFIARCYLMYNTPRRQPLFPTTKGIPVTKGTTPSTTLNAQLARTEGHATISNRTTHPSKTMETKTTTTSRATVVLLTSDSTRAFNASIEIFNQNSTKPTTTSSLVQSTSYTTTKENVLEGNTSLTKSNITTTNQTSEAPTATWASHPPLITNWTHGTNASTRISSQGPTGTTTSFIGSNVWSIPYTSTTDKPLTESTNVSISNITFSPYSNTTRQTINTTTASRMTQNSSVLSNISLSLQTPTALVTIRESLDESSYAPLISNWTDGTNASIKISSQGPTGTTTSFVGSNVSSIPYTSTTDTPLTESTNVSISNITFSPYSNTTRQTINTTTASRMTQNSSVLSSISLSLQTPTTLVTIRESLDESSYAPLISNWTDGTNASIKISSQGPTGTTTSFVGSNVWSIPYTSTTDTPLEESTNVSISNITFSPDSNTTHQTIDTSTVSRTTQNRSVLSNISLSLQTSTTLVTITESLDETFRTLSTPLETKKVMENDTTNISSASSQSYSIVRTVSDDVMLQSDHPTHSLPLISYENEFFTTMTPSSSFFASFREFSSAALSQSSAETLSSSTPSMTQYEVPIVSVPRVSSLSKTTSPPDGLSSYSLYNTTHGTVVTKTPSIYVMPYFTATEESSTTEMIDPAFNNVISTSSIEETQIMISSQLQPTSDYIENISPTNVIETPLTVYRSNPTDTATGLSTSSQNKQHSSIVNTDQSIVTSSIQLASYVSQIVPPSPPMIPPPLDYELLQQIISPTVLATPYSIESTQPFIVPTLSSSVSSSLSSRSSSIQPSVNEDGLLSNMAHEINDSVLSSSFEHLRESEKVVNTSLQDTLFFTSTLQNIQSLTTSVITNAYEESSMVHSTKRLNVTDIDSKTVDHQQSLQMENYISATPVTFEFDSAFEKRLSENPEGGSYFTEASLIGVDITYTPYELSVTRTVSPSQVHPVSSVLESSQHSLLIETHGSLSSIEPSSIAFTSESTTSSVTKARPTVSESLSISSTVNQTSSPITSKKKHSFVTTPYTKVLFNFFTEIFLSRNQSRQLNTTAFATPATTTETPLTHIFTTTTPKTTNPLEPVEMYPNKTELEMKTDAVTYPTTLEMIYGLGNETASVPSAYIQDGTSDDNTTVSQIESNKTISSSTKWTTETTDTSDLSLTGHVTSLDKIYTEFIKVTSIPHRLTSNMTEEDSTTTLHTLFSEDTKQLLTSIRNTTESFGMTKQPLPISKKATSQYDVLDPKLNKSSKGTTPFSTMDSFYMSSATKVVDHTGVPFEKVKTGPSQSSLNTPSKNSLSVAIKEKETTTPNIVEATSNHTTISSAMTTTELFSSEVPLSLEKKTTTAKTIPKTRLIYKFFTEQLTLKAKPMTTTASPMSHGSNISSKLINTTFSPSTSDAAMSSESIISTYSHTPGGKPSIKTTEKQLDETISIRPTTFRVQSDTISTSPREGISYNTKEQNKTTITLPSFSMTSSVSNNTPPASGSDEVTSVPEIIDSYPSLSTLPPDKLIDKVFAPVERTTTIKDHSTSTNRSSSYDLATIVSTTKMKIQSNKSDALTTDNSQVSTTSATNVPSVFTMQTSSTDLSLEEPTTVLLETTPPTTIKSFTKSSSTKRPDENKIKDTFTSKSVSTKSPHSTTIGKQTGFTTNPGNATGLSSQENDFTTSKDNVALLSMTTDPLLQVSDENDGVTAATLPIPLTTTKPANKNPATYKAPNDLSEVPSPITTQNTQKSTPSHKQTKIEFNFFTEIFRPPKMVYSNLYRDIENVTSEEYTQAQTTESFKSHKQTSSEGTQPMLIDGSWITTHQPPNLTTDITFGTNLLSKETTQKSTLKTDERTTTAHAKQITTQSTTPSMDLSITNTTTKARFMNKDTSRTVTEGGQHVSTTSSQPNTSVDSKTATTSDNMLHQEETMNSTKTDSTEKNVSIISTYSHTPGGKPSIETTENQLDETISIRSTTFRVQSDTISTSPREGISYNIKEQNKTTITLPSFSITSSASNNTPPAPGSDEVTPVPEIIDSYPSLSTLPPDELIDKVFAPVERTTTIKDHSISTNRSSSYDLATIVPTTKMKIQSNKSDALTIDNSQVSTTSTKNVPSVFTMQTSSTDLSLEEPTTVLLETTPTTTIKSSTKSSSTNRPDENKIKDTFTSKSVSTESLHSTTTGKQTGFTTNPGNATGLISQENDLTTSRDNVALLSMTTDPLLQVSDDNDGVTAATLPIPLTTTKRAIKSPTTYKTPNDLSEVPSPTTTQTTQTSTPSRQQTKIKFNFFTETFRPPNTAYSNLYRDIENATTEDYTQIQTTTESFKSYKKTSSEGTKPMTIDRLRITTHQPPNLTTDITFGTNLRSKETTRKSTLETDERTTTAHAKQITTQSTTPSLGLSKINTTTMVRFTNKDTSRTVTEGGQRVLTFSSQPNTTSVDSKTATISDNMSHQEETMNSTKTDSTEKTVSAISSGPLTGTFTEDGSLLELDSTTSSYLEQTFEPIYEDWFGAFVSIVTELFTSPTPPSTTTNHSILSNRRNVSTTSEATDHPGDPGITDPANTIFPELEQSTQGTNKMQTVANELGMLKEDITTTLKHSEAALKSSSFTPRFKTNTSAGPYIRTPAILIGVDNSRVPPAEINVGTVTTSATTSAYYVPATIKRSSIRHTIDLTSNNTYPNPRKEITEYIYNRNISKGKAKLSLKQIRVTVIRGAKSIAEQGKQVLLKTYQRAKDITTSITVTVYRKSRELFKTALDRVEALWTYCKSGINHYVVKPLLNARVLIKSKFESAYARLSETFERGKVIFQSTVDNVGKEANAYFESLANYYTSVYKQYTTEVRDIFESLKIPNS